jgi:uncharacterized protein
MRPPQQADRLDAQRRPQQHPRVYQSWHDILFLHWTCKPEDIQQALPPGLHVDTFNGKAWLGIVPLRMTGLRFAKTPPLPWISSCLEINVRTYVHDEQGRPGVWFFSLDCNRWPAVVSGRALYKLNYQLAKMEFEKTGKKITYHALRNGEQQQERIAFRIRDPLPKPEPGSLEFFLVERYLMFSASKRHDRLYSAQIHHAPYELLQPDVGHWQQAAFIWNGASQFPKPPDHVLYSPGVKVEIFGLKPVR